MTIQEIIEAIDAEIAKTQAASRKLRLDTQVDTIIVFAAYITRLRSAKELVEKAKEVGA